ncbi:response regulator transcription factor [Clostridiaceae bacterium UIB06]|uniref:Response regulator transcription factor n=1 Tax=Clostridium thailandense TaxID=2794346 RepID=A0A949TNF0_9CLOT|nr:response regulator transcription factor [Clostridium thailandense]MBV7273647.1 response regulator transcription factor [Clostridium thailandense]MCH5137039.1 response regulator transcription factor [Clostridiaceae bacterium UIB06]
MGKTILVIEDEEDIRDILSYYIKKEGFSVKEAENGKGGIDIIKKEEIDLIILDLMLPDISGYDVCKEISKDYRIPIIMLTAKNDIVDKILGLELGADDYVTKPFDVREIIARIKVCLRRIESLTEEKSEEVIQLSNNIRIYEKRMEVFKGDELIKFKPKEYELLITLAKNTKIVLSRDKLLQKVWGYDFEGDSRTVDVHIQRIRKKLDSNDGQSVIETVFGVGYKML